MSELFLKLICPELYILFKNTKADESLFYQSFLRCFQFIGSKNTEDLINNLYQNYNLNILFDKLYVNVEKKVRVSLQKAQNIGG